MNVEYSKKDPLHWCLLKLQNDPEYELSTDHAAYFSFSDIRLDKNNVSERDQIDKRLYGHISDMASIHELLSTLRFQQPLHSASRFSLDNVNDNDKTRIYWRHEEGKVDKFSNEQLEHLGGLLKDFNNIHLPTGRETKGYFTKAVAAREKIISFWKHVRDMVRVQYSNVEPVDSEQEDAMVRFRIEPAHLNQLEHEKQRLQEIQANQVLKENDSKKRYEVREEFEQLSLQDEPRCVFNPEPAKGKIETRPNRTATSTADGDDAAMGDATENVNTGGRSLANSINVKPSSFKLLSKMFHSAEDTKKKARWPDFVSAMSDAGFIARQGSGSAVLFENDHNAGKIVIHRPHPVSEVSPLMFKWIGKRMNKWFGWTAESFVEAKSGGEIV